MYLVRFHYVSAGSRIAQAQGREGGRRARRRTATSSVQRIAKIVERLPEGEAKRVGQHMSLEVRKKRFGWFMIDHHGDGRVDLNCKASADMHDILQRPDAGAFPRAEVRRQQGLGRDLARPAEGRLARGRDGAARGV